MLRKVKHPYQILEANELIKDEEYVFTYLYKDKSRISSNTYLFGGVFKDSKGVIENPPNLLKQGIVTIHLDGVHPLINPRDKPILVYWKKILDIGWDWLSTYLGDIDIENPSIIDRHIVVLQKHWKDDPKIYDDVVERKIHVVSNIDMNWEQKINAKRDAAMAKAFGFK